MDLEGVYPEMGLEGFHPTHRAQVRGHGPVDFVSVEEPGEHGIAYGYVPGQTNPVYAIISSGKWQHLEIGGIVEAEQIRYDANWVPLHVRAGHVYFVESGVGGPIKIGWSQDVSRRIGELQVANAHKLRLLGILPGTMVTESEMHTKFAQFRMEAEWFENHQKIREFITKNCR